MKSLLRRSWMLRRLCILCFDLKPSINDCLLQLGAKCTVKHYYFNSWSDCGVPSSETALIEFSKIVQNDRQNPKAPIVVHCRSVKILLTIC